MSTGSPPPVSSTLVKNFGYRIEEQLKSGEFSDYQSGDEIPFINDVIDLLDGKYAYDGQQVLLVKCKKAHSSPMVTYDGLQSQYNKQSVELGDLLFVFNFWVQKTVAHRQCFISQSKCWREKDPGYLYWEIDQSQFELLNSRPEFELINKDATETHNLQDASDSFFSYSFVSDVHRPFFYQTKHMDTFVDWSYSTPRFYYGKNPPYGNRYLYSVLKNGVRRRYGTSFNSSDPVFTLLEEIYEHASLNRSSTPNSLAYPDGGRNQGEFAIINVDVDLDGGLTNLDLPSDDDQIFEANEADLKGTIRSAFAEIDTDGLDFDSI